MEMNFPNPYANQIRQTINTIIMWINFCEVCINVL